ncbi:hypothetical protein [Arsenicicoccus sp. oral taxon 190]|uniref:hypothetical protein n=1 Tax=Arsenicicoccus sp. oral taxon 190 TaxID=1658671 RepID=UPI00067A1A5B|nr:hypothetical protein [Arsenicicoccus sp. oral taxon 190]AKT51003.1 hypothetical protein ADJ73_06145 [Arsenicicoccus sp. oral taxon 190]
MGSAGASPLRVLTDAHDTAAHHARLSLDDAQALLEEVQADLTRLDEFLAWLEPSRDRVHRLERYYAAQGMTDVETVLSEDPEAVTPPVGNEDAAWEAISGRGERMMRLLRLVTAEQTAPLDMTD